MSGGFVKLYGTILDSSIWGESLATRIVWISLLAMADKDGRVAASSDGIARRANVSLKQTDAALDVLSKPDPRSKSDDHEGRRVERVDGGWQILNYAKYRELRTDKQIADAERIKEKRERGDYDSRGPRRPDATRSNVATEAEANADTENYTTPTALEQVAAIFPNPRSALPMLRGMTEGLGTVGMKPVTAEVLAEAAAELQASGGDVTPHRFKAFVRKVLERSSAPRAQPRRPSDKTARSMAALNEFLAESETTDAEVITDGI